MSNIIDGRVHFGLARAAAAYRRKHVGPVGEHPIDLDLLERELYAAMGTGEGFERSGEPPSFEPTHPRLTPR